VDRLLEPGPQPASIELVADETKKAGFLEEPPKLDELIRNGAGT